MGVLRALEILQSPVQPGWVSSSSAQARLAVSCTAHKRCCAVRPCSRETHSVSPRGSTSPQTLLIHLGALKMQVLASAPEI